MISQSEAEPAGNMMAPERFQRLSDLFAEALEQKNATRSEFVETKCSNDKELKAELDRLLELHDQAGRTKQIAGGATTASTATLDFPAGMLLKQRYGLGSFLGEGGFGLVYLAHDVELDNRPVVIKFLREQLNGEWFLRKFNAEWQALARIRHPGVVGILDHGQAPNGTPFLVMEFVDGMSLGAAIRKGGMDLRRAGGLMCQIADALGAAHEQSVCHLD